MNLKFTNITYEVQTCSSWKDVLSFKAATKTLLHGVSGEMRGGELAAIMGPSGAGKSTLMNILSGYRLQTSGEILCDGNTRVRKDFRKQSSYITQNDFLLPQLTVMETMSAAVNLKMSQASKQEKYDQVCNILNMMSLMDARDISAKNVSGGEQKRLSIAQELLSHTPIMFFDEPTSGLDSLSSLQCMQILKNLALNGRTTICTIHQPTAMILDMFDKLYVLAEGQCIYDGSVKSLLPFLKHHGLCFPDHYNPADCVIDVAWGIYGNGELHNSLKNSVKNGICKKLDKEFSNAPDTSLPSGVHFEPPNIKLKTIGAQNIDMDKFSGTKRSDIPEESASCWTEIRVLLLRTILIIFRDKVQDNTACLFLSLYFLMYTAMIVTLFQYPQERSVLTREHMNNWYRLETYYFARTVADIPFQIFFGVLFFAIVYIMSGQPMEANRLWYFILYGTLVAAVAQSMGLFLSSIATPQVAIFLGATVSVPIAMFGGFFVTFKHMPAYLIPISYLSFMRYGFEGLILAIYGFDRPLLSDCPADNSTIWNRDPVKIIDGLKFHNRLWLQDIGILLLILLMFRLAWYCVLRYQLKLNQ